MTTESPEIRLRAAAPSDADDVIALSIETFRAEHAPSQRAFHERQAEWREGKSPTVVARNGDGAFLGYAFSRPNQAGVFERTDGQVAVLTQVAVVPDARGRGVGAALVSRSLTTLRMLGYSIASAQMQADVAPWYARQGWTIYPPVTSRHGLSRTSSRTTTGIPTCPQAASLRSSQSTDYRTSRCSPRSN